MTTDVFMKKSERIVNIYLTIWGLLFIPGFLFCMWCIVYDMDQIAGLVVFGWMMAFFIPAIGWLGPLAVFYLAEQIKEK